MADITSKVTPEAVKKMFPDTPLAPIKKNLPFVLSALSDADLGDKPMVLMALSTIRSETEGFVPISEFKSKFNTKTKPFDLYDAGTKKGKGLGNTQPGDGPRFKGRGFVQLTGRSNYTVVGKQLKIDLTGSPDDANDPTIAGRILAQFLKNKESAIRSAVKKGDLKTARKLVNGGSHGLKQFKSAFKLGESAIPDV